MRRRRLANRRGIVLIGSYLILSLFLIYSNAVSMRTASQQLGAQRFHNQVQALELAEGARAQLISDFYDFLRADIYQNTFAGNAVAAMQWLNDMETGAEVPAFTLEDVDTDAAGAGTSSGDARTVTLPSGSGRAWIVSIERANPLDLNPMQPRLLTIESEATVGGVTQRMRSTYELEMGMSDIFRYAYFLNNYGWFTVNTGWVGIAGEMRSNGDLRLGGDLGNLWVDGHLYASENPAVYDPNDPFELPAEGIITGDPNESNWWEYFWWKTLWSRPERRLSFPDQPAVGGGATPYLADGLGYEGDYPDPDDPDQRRYERQITQDMPYLGDFDLYQDLAASHNGGAGSTLTYNLPGPNGVYGDGDDVPTTITTGTASSAPLVLVGTWWNPIVIDGPVVIGGDVIIKGYVAGRGTIYSGRNVHVVGNISYTDPPMWPALQREQNTGRIWGNGVGYLGWVCNDGAYVPEGGGGCP
jgi:hypothetical protein